MLVQDNEKKLQDNAGGGITELMLHFMLVIYIVFEVAEKMRHG